MDDWVRGAGLVAAGLVGGWMLRGRGRAGQGDAGHGPTTGRRRAVVDYDAEEADFGPQVGPLLDDLERRPVPFGLEERKALERIADGRGGDLPSPHAHERERASRLLERHDLGVGGGGARAASRSRGRSTTRGRPATR